MRTVLIQSPILHHLIALGAMFASFKCCGEEVNFLRDLAPVLVENCLACHGETRAEGGYRIDTFDHLRRPGDSGLSPLGEATDDESELLRRITSGDVSERMPAGSPPLDESVVKKLEVWINAGATSSDCKPSKPLRLQFPPPDYHFIDRRYPDTWTPAALAIAGSGELCIGGYHEVVAYDLKKNTPLMRIGNLPAKIHAIDYSPTENVIVVAGGRPGSWGEYRIASLQDGKLLRSSICTKDVITSVAFSPDGKHIAVASHDGVVVIQSVTGALTKTLQCHASTVNSIAWSSDGKRIITASQDCSSKVIDVQNCTIESTYQGHDAPVILAGFDSDNVWSVGANAVHVWNIESQQREGDPIELPGQAERGYASKETVLIAVDSPALVLVELANRKTSELLKPQTEVVALTASNELVAFSTLGTNTVSHAPLSPGEALGVLRPFAGVSERSGRPKASVDSE